jgi:hypothetical protein
MYYDFNYDRLELAVPPTILRMFPNRNYIYNILFVHLPTFRTDWFNLLRDQT